MEYVMISNGIASLAIGVYCLFAMELPPELSLALVPAVFLFLTGCLLNRRLIWIAVVLGSLVNAGLGVGLFILFTHTLHPLAPWFAGPLGFVVGAGASILFYREVGRITHD